MKAREMMFRESMRISVSVGTMSSSFMGGLASALASGQSDTPESERDKLRKFQEQEKKRYKAEEQRCELKHRRQLEELRASADSSVKGLIFFFLHLYFLKLEFILLFFCYRTGTTAEREAQDADGTRGDETQVARGRIPG